MNAAASPVVWITGLPSSGKSLLAARVIERLREREVACGLLDGDEVRDALLPRPGYDDDARTAFYATLANLAALLANQGLVVLVPATANRRAFREQARSVAPRFIEVFVDVPLSVCVERDDKGLYARAERGDATQMPGAGADYEPPAAPDVVASGGEDTSACEQIVRRAIAD